MGRTPPPGSTQDPATLLQEQGGRGTGPTVAELSRAPGEAPGVRPRPRAQLPHGPSLPAPRPGSRPFQGLESSFLPEGCEGCEGLWGQQTPEGRGRGQELSTRCWGEKGKLSHAQAAKEGVGTAQRPRTETASTPSGSESSKCPVPGNASGGGGGSALAGRGRAAARPPPAGPGLRGLRRDAQIRSSSLFPGSV